jgi:hypothetical protein
VLVMIGEALRYASAKDAADQAGAIVRALAPLPELT